MLFLLVSWVALTQIKPISAAFLVIFIVLVAFFIQTIFNSFFSFREDLKTQVAVVLVKKYGITQGDALNKAHQYVWENGMKNTVQFIKSEVTE